MAALEINHSDFDKTVLQSEKPVLVDFWAPWCVPCLMMAPTLDSFAGDADLKEKLIVGKVNVDNPTNRSLGMTYNIQSIPNMKLFYKGKIVKEFIGVQEQASFKQELLQEIAKLTS